MKNRKPSKENHLERFSKFYRGIQERSDTKIKGYIDIQRTKSDEDMKRHVSALSEEFQGRVKVIGEQYGDIQKTLKSHTAMIGNLAEDISIIKINVEFLKDGLKKKVDYDEFLALERRMSVLEAKVK